MEEYYWYFVFIFLIVFLSFIQKRVFGLGLFEAWPDYETKRGKLWVLIAPTVPVIISGALTYVLVALKLI